MDWHHLDIEATCARLAASPDGLSSEQARQRLAQYGPNVIPGAPPKSPFILFLGQFKDFMILVLIAAAIVAGVIGETVDTIVIMSIVVLNAVIGFLQEYRAERDMAALKEMAAPHAALIRDGAPVTIPAADLVPGDMVLLEAGDIVPADLRLFKAVHLSIEEAALTGESIPAAKQATTLQQGDVALGDRVNLAFRGTIVTYGRGKGMVVATGLETELGRIARLLGEEEKAKTPLQRRLEVFGRRISLAILAVCLAFFCAGLVRGEGFLVMLLTALSLAVAAIPEALPAVISVALALGARKLAAQKALVRTLPAVETLGSITHICTDKTGTLTQNRMTVEAVFTGEDLLSEKHHDQAFEGKVPYLFWTALALCHEVRIDSSGAVGGDPTETALFLRAREQGFDGHAMAGKHQRVAEVPFDSERKLMTTVHAWQNGLVSFTKGAPEAVLKRSMEPAGLQRRAADLANRLAEEGFRVIAVAMRQWPRSAIEPPVQDWEEELTFLGLAALLDPPRPEAQAAVATCRSAGITAVMITGDHPRTAATIAGRLGILEAGASALMTGAELATLPLETIEERVAQIRVYARVAPDQKLTIVKALQQKGELVAMTGDGVNDAPALKRSDIGIAMGITGTDVARESADLILLDDNFATIVNAIREGRRIYDNIRKFIKYLLTTNAGEIVVVATAPFIGLPMPLLPVQILWINLMTDALPALALSLEPAEGNVMARAPRPPQESIFAHGLGLHIIVIGLLMGVLVLGTQAWALAGGNTHWQTIVFTILCFTQLFHVLAIRSERQSLFSIGLFSNKPLLGAVLVSLVLQLAVVYLPFLNPVFKTVPLQAGELILAFLVSSLVFLAVELEKMIRRARR